MPVSLGEVEAGDRRADGRESGANAPVRLLFVRLRSLGDTVLMTPAVTVAKRLVDCRVAVLVEEPYDQVLRGNPDIDSIFVVPRRGLRTVQRVRALLRIRAWRPNLAVDLHGGTTSALLTAFSGASARVGYAGSRNSRLYSIRVPDSKTVWGRELLHTVEHQLSPLRHLRFPVEPIPPLRVPVSEEARGKALDRLQLLGLRPGEFVLVHPAAAFDTKQWEAEKFAALGVRLASEGKDIAFTAGPGDRSLLEKIEALTKVASVDKIGDSGARDQGRRIHFIPPQPLSELAALISLCRVYVGNDTGPTHMAAALGRRVVVIFGSSDSVAWRPWNVEHRLLQARDLPCIPCHGYYCLHFDEPRCIRSITLDEVAEAVRSLLRD